MRLLLWTKHSSSISLANGVRMAYIDSKLANARSANLTPTTPSEREVDHGVIPSAQPDILHGLNAGSAPPLEETGKPQTPNHGLTPSATEGPTHAQARPKPKPPRLGRDGKPLRPRKDRYRRTSFDIARDAMVEQVLRESRLDIYEDPAGHQPSTKVSAGLDEDADERMAAEFRRDFIAAQEERNVRRPPAPPPSGKGDPLKGPKLGGSRSQRAAMRAIEEKAAKGKK